MNGKIKTFGEVMLRISPELKGERIFQANQFRIEPGGSESNVAVALSNLGNSVSFITTIPDNNIKHIILRYFRKYNIDIKDIVVKGNRIGMYWTENGMSLRASKVIYDRDNSAFSECKYEDYNWNSILSDSQWMHISGINAALNENICNMAKKLLDEVKRREIYGSIDLNFRNNLWKWVGDRSQIRTIYEELCSKVSLIIGNESDFYDCLGIRYQSRLKSDKELNIEEYNYIINEVFNKFCNLKYVAISLRSSISASENNWQGVLGVREGAEIKIYTSDTYNIIPIEDRVGAGDSFSAGIIHGINNYQGEHQKIIEFAAAFSSLKHTILGDSCEFFEDDVLHLIDTKGSGRIVR